MSPQGFIGFYLQSLYFVEHSWSFISWFNRNFRVNPTIQIEVFALDTLNVSALENKYIGTFMLQAQKCDLLSAKIQHEYTINYCMCVTFDLQAPSHPGCRARC